MKNQNLQELVSYKKGFTSMRIITMVAVIGSLILSGLVYFKYMNESDKMSNVIYLYNERGERTTAEKTYMTAEHRAIEYKNHVVNAVILLNQYDEGTIDHNLEKASYYFGDCFKDILFRFDDQRIKQKLQNENIYTTVTVNADSVKLDLQNMKGVVKYKQSYKKAGVKKINNLSSTIEFSIEDFERSNANSYGVKITTWQLIDSRQTK
ncbi:MAG: hypothetical protein AB8F74_19400 [Saprospiraceae bacterium]